MGELIVWYEELHGRGSYWVVSCAMVTLCSALRNRVCDEATEQFVSLELN